MGALAWFMEHVVMPLACVAFGLLALGFVLAVIVGACCLLAGIALELRTAFRAALDAKRE